MLDPPDPDRSYELIWRDGASPAQAINPPGQGAFIFTATYPSPGRYTWQASAKDSYGGTSYPRSGIIDIRTCGSRPPAEIIQLKKIRDDIGNTQERCSNPAEVRVEIPVSALKVPIGLTIAWGDGVVEGVGLIVPDATTVTWAHTFRHCYPIAGFYDAARNVLYWDWMAHVSVDDATIAPVTLTIRHEC